MESIFFFPYTDPPLSGINGTDTLYVYSISKNVYDSTLVYSSNDEVFIPSEHTILDGLQIAYKHGNHFLKNDNNIE